MLELQIDVLHCVDGCASLHGVAGKHTTSQDISQAVSASFCMPLQQPWRVPTGALEPASHAPQSVE